MAVKVRRRPRTDDVGRSAAHRLLIAGGAVFAMLSAPTLDAQTDYFNTDRNRPVRIEDAYATERFALEAKLAPLRLERSSQGYHWGFHPELGYGILPRTSIEVGLPIEIDDGTEHAESRSGLAGVELSLFHNLNRETRSIPALAVRADLTLPVGSRGPEHASPGLTGIVTRSHPLARVHLNAGYRFRVADGDAHERWLAGFAVDRPDALRALLYTVSVHASGSGVDTDGAAWHAEGGARYQLSPYLAIDAGIGRRFTVRPTWYATFGSAVHLGVRSWMPRR